MRVLLGGCCHTTFLHGRLSTSKQGGGYSCRGLRGDGPRPQRTLLRLASSSMPDPSAVILDSRTLRSSPESGHPAGYDAAKRKKGSKVHAAVDTLGHLLALHGTPASEQDRAQVEELAEAVQEATGESVELAYVDQGYTGEEPVGAQRRSTAFAWR